MRIVDIAKKTSYSAKTIRKALDYLVEKEAIRFTVRFRPNKGDNVTFIVKIEWDENIRKLDSLISWLSKEFGNELWLPLVSVNQDCIVAIFIVEHVREISPILEKIRHEVFTTSVVSKMGRESYSFPDIRREWLEKRFAEIG
jgi:hypothetical protein